MGARSAPNHNGWAAARPYLIAIVALTLILAGCAIIQVESPLKIALLAPFEGRYREIGYEALYAARLAIGESESEDIALLPIDDGGTVESAIARAKALADDPLVRAVVVLGYEAADSETQAAFADLPVLIVGNWLVEHETAYIFMLSSPDLPQFVNAPIAPTDANAIESGFTGNEVAAMQGFRQIAGSLADVTVVSSYPLPDDAFRQRILTSDPFATAPGLLAVGTYDAVGLLVTILAEAADVSRQGVLESVKSARHTGISGEVRFRNGYWADAPIYAYVYSPSGDLVLADDIIK